MKRDVRILSQLYLLSMKKSTLKEKFGKIFIAQLRALTIKFDTYKKRANYSMHKHLRYMSNMIDELKDVGHDLTNE
uniref:Uncharacterized protein n=1 Tax=Manihot esculenta TaxID=3983 RepID=A0A2C9URN6_MANES